MSKVPWYPLGSRSKNATSSSSSTSGSTNCDETLLNSSSFSGGMNRPVIFPIQQPVQYGTKRKHEPDQGKQAGGKQNSVLYPSRPIRSYVQYKHRTDFTPEELAEKRRIAIEEEAVKKKERDRIAQIKLEERWVELGKVICSLNPYELGLNETPHVDYTCTLDETLANVSNFTKNLNLLVGYETRGTVLAHSLGFAGALCNVPTKSFIHVERRVNSSKQIREEMEQREKEAKARMDECWIEIGKAIYSFTLGEFGVSVKDSSLIASNELDLNEPEKNKTNVVESDDVVASTSTVSNRIQKEKSTDPEESEDEDYVEEDEDFEELPAKRSRSKNLKKGLANRGEDVVANFFNFSTALRDMMDIHSKQTCLRSPYEFTSEQLIKQSDESRRRFAEFKEIEERNGYVHLNYGKGGRPPAPVTLAASDRIRLAVAEEAEKKIKRDEEARIKKENHWIKLGAAICNLCIDDFILPPEDSKSDSDSEELNVAERGEEIIIAVATFVQSLKLLVGEKTANESILADQNTLASTLCGVTRAAMSTRYSFKNKRKRRVNS